MVNIIQKWWKKAKMHWQKPMLSLTYSESSLNRTIENYIHNKTNEHEISEFPGIEYRLRKTNNKKLSIDIYMNKHQKYIGQEHKIANGLLFQLRLKSFNVRFWQDKINTSKYPYLQGLMDKGHLVFN